MGFGVKELQQVMPSTRRRMYVFRVQDKFLDGSKGWGFTVYGNPVSYDPGW